MEPPITAEETTVMPIIITRTLMVSHNGPIFDRRYRHLVSSHAQLKPLRRLRAVRSTSQATVPRAGVAGAVVTYRIGVIRAFVVQLGMATSRRLNFVALNYVPCCTGRPQLNLVSAPITCFIVRPACKSRPFTGCQRSATLSRRLFTGRSAAQPACSACKSQVFTGLAY